MNEHKWRDNAACKNTDPNIFVPAEGRGSGVKAYKVARTYCARCTVRQECLDYAIGLEIQYGMFGGLTPRERRPSMRNAVGSA